jgi:hypothetical protein
MTDFDSLSVIWVFWFRPLILLILSRSWDVELFWVLMFFVIWVLIWMVIVVEASVISVDFE